MYRFIRLPKPITTRCPDLFTSISLCPPLPTFPRQLSAFSTAFRHSLSWTNLLHGMTATSVTFPPRKRQKQKQNPPRPLWIIKEDELEEKFIKGGGPGGQKINKSNIKVQITHKPTGLVVNSQDLRSQEKNRAKAREILALKLEQMQNPETCRLNVLAERKRVTKRNRAKKAAKKHRKREAESSFETDSKADSGADSVTVPSLNEVTRSDPVAL